MVKTVVFDVGETLVNESRRWRLWSEWLMVPDHVLFAVLGATIERGEHHRRVFELLHPGFDLETAREERRNAAVPDEFDASDLYADVPACLHALHQRGLRIGIAGNQPAGLERILKDLDLPVDFVASKRSNLEKPSPRFFQKIVDSSKGVPNSVAYVGDRIDHDVVPARAAGMIAVFLRRGPWGFLQARRPEAAQAHLRLESLRELPGALDELARSQRD
ncbi:MAG: HAD-IA family hydrolase [Bryobacteraceae bacterium]|jgi:HAD superfamily hydrolase (TIGR01549 family)